MGEQTVRWLTEQVHAAGAIPAWAAGAITALVVFIVAKKIFGRSEGGILAALAPAGIVVVALAALAALTQQFGNRNRFDVSSTFEARVSQLTMQTLLPGSPLGCLHIETGMAVDSACENAIFSSAPSVAGAIVYTSARLAILRDIALDDRGRGAEFAKSAAVADVRRSLERDPFGITSYVLASEYSCTAERCDALALFGHNEILKGNLKGRVLDGYIKRHAEDWKESEAAVAKAPEPEKSVERAAASVPEPKVTQFDFPSAASIPPVSIMNPEPPAAIPPSGASQPALRQLPPQRPSSPAGESARQP